ncbi:hypothetical protein Dimus_038005 [Dionaea muscipula]
MADSRAGIGRKLPDRLEMEESGQAAGREIPSKLVTMGPEQVSLGCLKMVKSSSDGGWSQSRAGDEPPRACGAPERANSRADHLRFPSEQQPVPEPADEDEQRAGCC